MTLPPTKVEVAKAIKKFNTGKDQALSTMSQSAISGPNGFSGNTTLKLRLNCGGT